MFNGLWRCRNLIGVEILCDLSSDVCRKTNDVLNISSGFSFELYYMKRQVFYVFVDF